MTTVVVPPSNLSNYNYGYDFVVAVTQDSINATMLAFLAQLKEPIVEMIYIADVKGNPVPIDAATLKVKAKGTDPFSIPTSADVSTSPDIANLVSARFLMAFRAQIGLPPKVTPASLMNVVTLDDTISKVKFNMYCSTFTVVMYNPGTGYVPTPSWSNICQEDTSPWIFTSIVDLRLEQVPGVAYNSLPQNVQQQISNLGAGAFSVQQLLFDLTNATLESLPTYTGDISSDAQTIINHAFLGLYFAQLKQDGQPILSCNIVASNTPASTLKPTALKLMVNPYLGADGQQAWGPLTTLNYLCDVGGKTLPPTASNFSWNWVADAASQADYDGVVSINRSWFVNYFNGMLTSYVQNNCLSTWVHVVLNGVMVDYSWSLTPGQAPTITTPPTGATVLTYSYTSSASDQAGLNGDTGSMTLQNNYTMSVQFTSNTIVISQHQVVYAKITVEINSGSGNIVDKTIVDTYQLSVNEFGNLQAVQAQPSVTDISKNPKTNSFLNFFDNVDSLMDTVENYVRAFTNTSLIIPVSTAQNFVFPGGNTFLFKNAVFSDHQDLVTFISYTDVSGGSTSAAVATAGNAKVALATK